jgi:hypothetical protein
MSLFRTVAIFVISDLQALFHILSQRVGMLTMYTLIPDFRCLFVLFLKILSKKKRSLNKILPHL